MRDFAGAVYSAVSPEEALRPCLYIMTGGRGIPPRGRRISPGRVRRPGAPPGPQAAGGEFLMRSEARNSSRSVSIPSRSTPVSVLRTRMRGSFHSE